jgi:lysophospholipase L1-like esterase
MAKYKPTYINVSVVDINFIKLCKTDTGLDGFHPGSKTHQLVADAIKIEICK